MAFFSRAGKTSGVCKSCKRIKNVEGECSCNSGGTDAECGNCGAIGYIPDRSAPEAVIRQKIGCTCGSAE